MGLKMNLYKVGSLLVLSGVMACASIGATSTAMAQAATNCQIGTGVGCEEAFGSSSRGSASRQAAPAQTIVVNPTTPSYLAAFDAYRTEVKAEQTKAVEVLTAARTEIITSIVKTCQAVSPNQPTAACP